MSHYVSTSQPDMTHVVIKEMREAITYICAVTVKGHGSVSSTCMCNTWYS